jgi:putative hemolysin
VALTLARRPTEDGARVLPERFARKRDHGGLGPVLARSGALEARLAATESDVRRAQRLRYRVFFEEGGAIPDPARRRTRRDLCPFDEVSDHLVVLDLAAPGRDGSPAVVGGYRMLRQEAAERNFGFYSSREFRVDELVARRRGTRFLEVGRACIAASHRGGRVLELLWRGLWAYARHHNIDAMFGCAGLPGADPAAHGPAVRWLAAGGDPAWRVSPRADRAGSLGEDASGPPVSTRALIRTAPPLVKGYWRLGATFSPVPAVDPAFGATDLFVVLPLRDIEPRYLEHFGVEASEPPLAA